MIGRPPTAPQAVRPTHLGHHRPSTPFGNVLIADVPEYHLTQLNGVGVVSPGWAVADLARKRPIPDALVAADAAARLGVDLKSPVDHMRGWVGVERARWVAEHAHPLAETPIETLGRFTVIELGMPMPVLNAWVGDGRPEFRLDGLWPFHWAGYEADGGLKYDNRPDASRIVKKQVEREWRLRRMGLDLARFDWRLAFSRRKELGDRFSRLLADNPVRAEPIRWWKDVPGRGPVEPAPEDWPSPAPTSIVLPAGWDC